MSGRVEVSAELWERFQGQAALYREAVELLIKARAEILRYTQVAQSQQDICDKITEFLGN
jgi:hypothetical protein